MSKTERIFPLNTFGGRIQNRRKNILKISRPEFYDLIYPGVNISDDSKSKTVKNWESGETDPGTENLKKICTSLKCSADYLLGLDECTNKTSQFIQDYTGLTEKAMTELNKLTTYHIGKVRLAIIDYLLSNAYFTVALTDRINDFYTKYHFYETGKVTYLKEKKEIEALTGNDLVKILELEESGTYISTIDAKMLAERQDNRDATRFKAQKLFDDILERLAKYFYKKNSGKTS